MILTLDLLEDMVDAWMEANALELVKEALQPKKKRSPTIVEKVEKWISPKKAKRPWPGDK